MAKSKQTKKYARLAFLFGFLSLCLMIGPAAYYIILGFLSATVIMEKVVLTATIFMAILLTAICAINKWVFRSRTWLLVLALFLVIDNFFIMIVIFAASQVLDELIASPLARHFRNKKSINIEIDKRMGV